MVLPVLINPKLDVAGIVTIFDDARYITNQML